jgi:TonB-dependent SusC/RagA subfamily outer membrane receptor
VLVVKREQLKLPIQQITIHGTVIESKHHAPLMGVNIGVKGTTKGTTTDSLGNYRLTVPSPSDTLIFSYIGYKQKTVPIRGRSEIDVIMKSTIVKEKNLVVTAYGEERNKISLVGAVQSIKSPSKTLKIPSSSLTAAFAGRMAGVIAFQRSGQPGGNTARFFIRGISTFSGSSQPLIIIDGVQASAEDLNELSPSVIESFSILKDATATAVYGSRGANGVMVVTTKTGGNFAHPKINIRLESGVSTPTRIPKYANGVQFMNLFNQAVRGRNTSQVLYSQDKIRGTELGLNKGTSKNCLFDIG